MSTEIASFIKAAHSFCLFMERDPTTSDVSDAEVCLAELYATGLSLPSATPDEFDIDALAVTSPRAKNLSQLSYFVVLDPLKIDEPRVGLGDLTDDLNDTYDDIKKGLLAFDAGHEASAVFHWNLLRDVHWGEHALGALRALKALRNDRSVERR